jgi:hypothetical protein
MRAGPAFLHPLQSLHAPPGNCIIRIAGVSFPLFGHQMIQGKAKPFSGCLNKYSTKKHPNRCEEDH